MNWQEVRSEFDYDGSLRDLYVLNTDIKAWQDTLDFLLSSSYLLTYAVDNHEAELPIDVASIFRKRQEANAWLRVNASGIKILCHFFWEEQIEFDIDSREIDSEEAFNHLCDFMRQLGQHLGQSVILTPESNEQMAIIRYSPVDDIFTYTPVGIYH